MTTTSSAQERTQQAASTAADQGKHVAGVAKDEAQNVASEAVSQARSVVGDAVRNASDQANEQTRTQRDRLTGTLRSLGDDLDKMASQADSGIASELAREAAQRAHSISEHLDGREPVELLDDVRRFARERPGTFLLGALGAGVVAGRLLRGTKDGIEGAKATGGSTPGLTTGTSASGLGGTARPAVGAPATSPAPTPGVTSSPSTTTATGVSQAERDAATRAGVVGYGDEPTLGDDLLGGDSR